MSIAAEAWFKEIWHDDVVRAYGNKGFLLKSMVKPPVKVDGKVLYFPSSPAAGLATETKRGDTLKPINAGYSTIQIVTKEYEAPEEIFTRDINRMMASETQEAKIRSAKALGKRHDKVIMDAIHAGAGNYGTTIGAFNAAWDIDKAMAVYDALATQTDSDADEFFCVLPVRAFSQLMARQAFNRSEYVGDYPLMTGTRARTWNKIHWVEGYDSLFPKSGTDLTFYAWAKMAIGSGDTSTPEHTQGGENGIRTDINYDPRKRCYIADATIEVGATVLQTAGVVECRMKSDSAITVTAGL